MQYFEFRTNMCTKQISIFQLLSAYAFSLDQSKTLWCCKKLESHKTNQYAQLVCFQGKHRGTVVALPWLLLLLLLLLYHYAANTLTFCSISLTLSQTKKN